MATRVNHGRLTKVIYLLHPQNLLLDARISEISYICRGIAHFVPNVVPIATRVSRGKIRLAAFNGPSPKTTYRRKNLADISYTDRVIANFVPNFVAMATGEGPGKKRITPLDWPSLKTIPQNQKLRLYLIYNFIRHSLYTAKVMTV